MHMDSRLFLPGMDPVYLFCYVYAEGLKLVGRFPFARWTFDAWVVVAVFDPLGWREPSRSTPAR